MKTNTKYKNSVFTFLFSDPGILRELYCALKGVSLPDDVPVVIKEAVKKAVVYCCDHDILKELLEKNASEVLNMLMTEWNWDDALAVRYEEGHEEGMEKGMEKRSEEIVKNALDKGFPPETIHAVTGIDMETIERLGTREKKLSGEPA